MPTPPSKPIMTTTESHAPAEEATTSPLPGGTIPQTGPSKAALSSGAAFLVPGYEILGELGRGGMGVVYLARNVLMDRREVLKVVNQALLDRPGVMERFLREIRAAAMLRHNNVVQAYSAVQAGESIVFAMEYVEGEDLNKVVGRQGPLPIPYACHYVSQAALGLQHAYEQHMVHRDIKPHNLILSRQAKKHIVKVLDFGLAKAKREGEEVTDLTGVGAMMGTPAYMAPEQARDAARADIRADVYSLGCTLYFLLTGAPPFAGKSLFEVLEAHESAEAAPLHQVRVDAPAELAAVVARMMAKDPARRFQKPIDAAQALAPFIKPGSPSKDPNAGAASGPYPPAPTPPLHRTPKRPEEMKASGPYPAAIPLTDWATRKAVEGAKGGGAPSNTPPSARRGTNEIAWTEVDGVLYGAPTPPKRTIGDPVGRPSATAKKRSDPNAAGPPPKRRLNKWWMAVCLGVAVLLAGGEVWLWNNGKYLGETPRAAPAASPASPTTATSVVGVDFKPDDPTDHFNRGYDLDQEGRWEEAIKEYRRAIAIKADYAEAHNNLGLALGHQGKSDEEIEEYRRAIEIKPAYALAHFNLGCSLDEKGRWDDAIDEYRRAIAIKPDYAEAHNNLGLALRHQDHLTEATEELEKAAELKKAQKK